MVWVLILRRNLTREITIQVTDSAGYTFTETVTIDLIDVNKHDVSSIPDFPNGVNYVNETSIAAISDTDGSGDSVTVRVG